MATSAWPCFSGKTHVHEDVDMAHRIKWYHYPGTFAGMTFTLKHDQISPQTACGYTLYTPAAMQYHGQHD